MTVEVGLRRLISLAPHLVLFLVLTGFTVVYAESRHSPELLDRSLEIQRAPEVLGSWLSNVGKEDLNELLRNATSEGNSTLTQSLVKSVYAFINADSLAPLLVGARQLLALKTLNNTEDLAISAGDLRWLLYHSTLHLNNTGYHSLSSTLLKVLSGLVSYGDHNELSYFIIYLMKEGSLSNVSQELISELRRQTLLFLSYVDSGDFKRAAEVGVNASRTTSLVIGSYMYVIASTYENHVRLSRPDADSQSAGNVLTTPSQLLEFIEHLNISVDVMEVLRRLPPDELERIINRLEPLTDLNDEYVLEEISRYVMEREYYLSQTTGPLFKQSSPMTVVTWVDSADSDHVYKLSNQLNTLMGLVSVVSAFNSGQEGSLTEGMSFPKPIALAGRPTNPYEALFVIAVVVSLTVGILPLLKYVRRGVRSLRASSAVAGPVYDEDSIKSEVVRAFWRVVRALASSLEVKIERYETHRELKSKIIRKLDLTVGSRPASLLTELAHRYELVRFGNVSEDEGMRSDVRRLERLLLKE